MTTIEITITEDAVVTPDVLVRWHALETDLKRVMKQRDALVVERDAILVERDESIAGYIAVKQERDEAYEAEDSAQRTLIEACAGRGAYERRAIDAEASLLKASAEVGRLDQELAKLIADDARLRYLLKQADDNNVKLAERNVNLRYELEASEAKRLQLLAALDEKDVLLNDFSKENLRLAEVIKMKDDLDDRRQQELANVRQQLTELKLKHNQPAAFPWNLYGPNGFFFNSHAASITSKAAAEPATSKTEVKS